MAIDNPVFRVSANGITAPSFAEVREFFVEKAKSIFGQDINLAEDTQDGQLLSIFATAIHDINSQAVEIYSAYNPQTAYGVALDSAVKTNGITRRLASKSSVDIRIVGQAGTVIINGQVKDTFGNLWNLPDEVTIPSLGEVTVTAIADEAGAIEAVANSITEIVTPTRGWQTATNPYPAQPGVSEETDEELRIKQTQSTMQPSRSLWDGIVSSVAALPGVDRVAGMNNDTASTVDGVPAHSIAVVVSGGDAQQIAGSIFLTKGSGVGTYGSITEQIIDSYGGVNLVKFSRPTDVRIKVEIEVFRNPGYISTMLDQIKRRVCAYINSLPFGTEVNSFRVFSAAIHNGTEIDDRVDVQSATIKKTGGTAQITIPILWNEQPVCDPADVTVTVREEV